MEVFDEDKAVDFIINRLGEKASKYNDDDILDVIDIIWDYYEDHGMLDISFDDDDADETADVDELISHVCKMVKRDKGSNIDVNDIDEIVRAELEYEAQCNEI